MKADAINRLQGQKIVFYIPGPLDSIACKEAGLDSKLSHAHSYCSYVYRRNHNLLTPDFPDFPDIPTYSEYLHMKKERLRRYRISQALRERNQVKRLGLVGSKLELMIGVFRRRRLLREDKLEDWIEAA